MKTNLDKDFDQLFKSSFEDFEVAPSADSWKKISEELEKKPSKKLFVFWSAAASILLVLSIGIGLYTNNSAGVIPKVAIANDVLVAESPATESVNKGAIGGLAENKNVLLKSDLKSGPKIKSFTKRESDVEINITKEANQMPVNEVLATNGQEENVTRINPIKNIKTALQPEITEKNDEKIITDSESRLVLAQAFKSNEKSVEEKVVGKRIKFSSVGDLVNLVVAQVDKRENKIIKISKTEESENEITGINLGLFKFSKAEK